MKKHRVLSVAISASLVLGCREDVAPALGPAGLTDESRARGIEFSVARGGTDYFMPDSMGPGCALFDADGDGDLDAFFVQGIRASDGKLESEAGRDRLLLQGADGRFVDASAQSGVDDPRYGMGAAVADVDSDGDLDLFVTNFGSSRLYLNRGNATFEDATDSFGIREEGWAATAGFFDYDADGRRQRVQPGDQGVHLDPVCRQRLPPAPLGLEPGPGLRLFDDREIDQLEQA